MGIMAIRQLFWDGNDFDGRSLSCFKCQNKCIHFHVNTIENFVPHTEKSKTERLGRLRGFFKFGWDDSKSGFLDLKPEVFVVVGFDKGKAVNKFLAVIQGEVSDDREIEVLFLKPTKDKNIFQPDEKDVAWIEWGQIVGKLSKPQLVCKNNYLFYKFNNKITF